MVANRVTLKDVARAAGVHISTASRALNPETASVVKVETLERVTAAADTLGYRPHPLARGLRTNRTMSIGMVIPDVENPLFGPVIAGAEAVLWEEGYSVVIGNADRGPEHAEAVIGEMLERRIDGLILATASRDGAATASAARLDVPVVLVNREVDDRSIPAIVGDDHAGIELAVSHLANLGHHRIGHVAGPSWVSTGRARRQAFVDSMDSHHLPVGDDVIAEAEWYQVEPGHTAATELLTRYSDLTAIVAANDLLALGCYRAIRNSGGEIGADVSVTGYNDIPLLDLMQPPMTTVRVPYRQMGSQSATALLALLRGQGTPASMRLAPTLVERASTSSPPSGKS